MFALITGASRGIGKSTVLEFAHHGYNLVLICKNNIEILEEMSLSLSKKGITCLTYKCDISNYNDVLNLWEDLESKNISIDVLVNNAGISHVGLLQDMTAEEWNNTINTNLNSAFYMCKHAIPNMLKKGSGKIINISSVWGHMGASMEVAYSASKGGLIAFSKALAKEIAPSNIQVNTISFGAIETEMNNHLSDEDKQSLCDEIPACRMGSPKEAAKLIYDVANTSNYLTGANIIMDGGWC